MTLLLLLLLLFWLHLSTNVCVTPGDLPVASSNLTHTGIPTLDHGKNPEQNFGLVINVVNRCILFFD